MNDIAISASSIGKKYLIGHENRRERNSTLRDALVRTARGFMRSASDMARGRQLVFGDEVEEFWALRAVDFEIRRGEVVGIIGRNGAGKSTLLKILSRITEPSEGRVEIRGRVASLLEVGTGFHPELTGRENIYLNGAILGMRRAEITSKFDQIVEFAGVERFLDTPVKRYSSGMYVRLAFAVAAHLEPEILIIDEVLAVGDAEFQKKCLGKMQDVAGDGRTVLFVSHSIPAVQRLCSRVIVMRSGGVAFVGDTAAGVNHYIETGHAADRASLADVTSRVGRGELRFANVALLDHSGKETLALTTAHDGAIRLTLRGGDKLRPGIGRLGIRIVNRFGDLVFHCASDAACEEPLRVDGTSVVTCFIPRLPLSAGQYSLSLFLEVNGVIQDWIEAAVPLIVNDASYYGTSRNTPPGWEGKSVLVPHSWSVDNLR
jgi:lipopolysaccharide transport system ATP-binding protein